MRDAVVAYAFGATGVADAFYVAFRIPNLLRRLVAEGSLTIAFVPIYSEYLKKSRKQAHEVASIVFTMLSIFLAIIIVLGVALAPWIVKLIAYGFSDDPAKYELTVYLTRIIFPYIGLVSLVALSMGILNSLKRFAVPAAAPIFLNLGIIAGALVISRWVEQPAVGLAIGVIVGGVAQLALQIPALAKVGMLPRIKFRFKHPALKSLLFMMIPSAFGAAVYQFNVFVITLLASFLPSGSVSYLWYADRIAEFPLGIFAVSVAVATLPTLSDHVADKDLKSFTHTVNYSVRLSFLISIPAAVGLFLLAEPIVTVLFQRGAFTPAMAAATAGALKFFAVGIPLVSADRNLVPSFYALRKPKIPVMTAAVALVINVVAALILMQTMAHRGLALAMSIAATANFAMLYVMLTREIGSLGGRQILVSVARTIVTSAIMGVVIVLIMSNVNLFEGVGLWLSAVQLFALIIVGAAVYIASVRIINPKDFDSLMAIIRRQKPGARGSGLGPQKSIEVGPVDDRDDRET